MLAPIVDTVLYFEGDTHSSFRLVRAIKNRFGAVNEIGVFAMTERGLKGVANPSAIFLSTHGDPVAGSCVLVTLEGTRPLLGEIQALVDSGGPSPRRLSVGLDRDRLAMMLAVLHRRRGAAEAELEGSSDYAPPSLEKPAGRHRERGNRGLLTAASREPYKQMFDFPPGSTRA